MENFKSHVLPQGKTHAQKRPQALSGLIPRLTERLPQHWSAQQTQSA